MNKVAILGCVRDCQRFLSGSLDNVERIARLFQNHKIFLFENDSFDSTLSVLRQFSRKDPMRRRVITERYLVSRIPGRTRRLAYARQRLLCALRDSEFRPDVVVVMDMDDAGTGSSSALIHFIRKACLFQGWDAAFPRLSYDLAAWHPWPPTASKEAALAELRKSKHRDPVRVFSTFNGIGVYKGPLYAIGRYLVPGQQVYGRSLPASPCEHMTFHSSLGSRARLVMLTDSPWPLKKISHAQTV